MHPSNIAPLDRTHDRRTLPAGCRGSCSPTSPARPASTSSTTPARTANGCCRKPWAAAWPSSTTTTTATGSPVRQLDDVALAAATGRAADVEAVPEPRGRYVRRRVQGVRNGRHVVRDGGRHRRLRRRRIRRRLRHGRRREPAVSQRRRRGLRGCHRQSRRRRKPGAWSTSAAFVDIDATATSTCSRATTSPVARDRSGGGTTG